MTLSEILIAGFICAMVFPIDYAIDRWIQTKREKAMDREIERLFAEAKNEKP